MWRTTLEGYRPPFASFERTTILFGALHAFRPALALVVALLGGQAHATTLTVGGYEAVGLLAAFDNVETRAAPGELRSSVLHDPSHVGLPAFTPLTVLHLPSIPHSAFTMTDQSADPFALGPTLAEGAVLQADIGSGRALLLLSVTGGTLRSGPGAAPLASGVALLELGGLSRVGGAWATTFDSDTGVSSGTARLFSAASSAQVASTPLPGGAVLLLGGLAAVVLLRRRPG
jgi:hypothetical protein